MSWLDLPPLSALRSFAALAQTGSVTGAAAALNVTHAAVSQQIRALEKHMGVALARRQGRTLTLTPDGALLARALNDGFETMANAVAALMQTDAGRPLLITTTPSFASGWLMPRLAGFRAEHPEIDLSIDPSATVKTFEPGDVDIALRYGGGNWPGLESELLLSSPIVVVAARSLVGDDPDLSLAALTDFPWLEELGANEATAWFARRGLARNPRHGITSLPGNLMMEAARAGQGVAIAARAFLEADIAAGRMRLLYEDREKEGYWMVTRPGVQRPPLRAFVRWLRRESSKS
ncbi:MAG: LysR family transcriptional regulator [Roseivivax sp.]|nr:LysR family transcriptional regulator [Roseivivax sp.]